LEKGAKLYCLDYSRKQAYSQLYLISWRFCHDCCRSMKEKQQKGMRAVFENRLTTPHKIATLDELQ
jgi:hypothetical protein